MCPERSVIMSLISDLPGDCWKTGVGRVAVDFGAGQGAKHSADIRSDLGQASNAGQRQNQRNPGGREAEGQLAALLARYPADAGRGCASLAPCHPPFCLYTRPIPFFQKSPKLLRRLVSMLARLGSRLNRPAQIAALLVRKILGTPE